MRRLLAVDAVWDFLAGALLCVTPWASAPLLGWDVKAWWPLFLVAAIASFAFGVLLLRASRGIDSKEVCTAAAIANGLTAAGLIVAVSLIPFRDAATNGILLIIALVCGGFAFLEWRHVRA